MNEFIRPHSEKPDDAREGKKPFQWPGAAALSRNVAVEETEDPVTARMRKEWQEEKERERLPMSASVSFSSELLDRVVTDDLFVEARKWGNSEEIDERKRSYLEMIDRLKRLPDLHFSPGITLIVGDNGAGKSTLARALFYAMQYKSRRDEGRSAEVAHSMVFEPHKNTVVIVPADVSDLKRSGLAPQIAQAMTVEQVGVPNASAITYEDCTTISGMHTAQDYHGYGGKVSAEDIMSDARPRRSNRQTIDASHGERRAMIARKPNKKEVLFVDEPEIGMSPRRQKELREDVSSLTTKASIEIVITNSLALYDDQDLPRIDLDYPERGIFRPRDYPV